MTYTYSDIIIDPNDPRVEVGAYYYFGTNAPYLLRIANVGGCGMELTDTHSGDNGYVFSLANASRKSFNTSLIIRKKEDDKSSFKVGDFVRDNDNGDKVYYVYDKPTYSEPVSISISRNGESYLRVLDCLTKVKAHVEPYDLSNPDTRDILRGKWVTGTYASRTRELQIIGFIETSEGWTADLGTLYSAKSLLEEYTFLNGAPCGEYVEDEE